MISEIIIIIIVKIKQNIFVLRNLLIVTLTYVLYNIQQYLHFIFAY